MPQNSEEPWSVPCVNLVGHMEPDLLGDFSDWVCSRIPSLFSWICSEAPRLLSHQNPITPKAPNRQTYHCQPGLFNSLAGWGTPQVFQRACTSSSRLHVSIWGDWSLWYTNLTGELRKTVGRCPILSDGGIVHCLRLPKGQLRTLHWILEVMKIKSHKVIWGHTLVDQNIMSYSLFKGLGRHSVPQTWLKYLDVTMLPWIWNLDPPPPEWIRGWGLMDDSEPVLQKGCSCSISHI
jgi:hypothetical protein